MSLISSFSEHFSFLVGYSPIPFVTVIQVSLGILAITLICEFALTVDSSGHYLQSCQSVREVCELHQECVFLPPYFEMVALKMILTHSENKPKLLTCNVPHTDYSKPAIYLW